MRIVVNGQQHDLSAATLGGALTELGFQSPAIATAVNGDFVPAANRANRKLLDGDRLEVLAPMQGG